FEFVQCICDSGVWRKSADRTFADDEEALDDPGLHTVDHLDECGSCCQGEFLFPGTSQLGARVLIGEVERSGKQFRDRSHFNRPLIVILFRQGSKAAALCGHLSGQEKQIERIETDAIAAWAA